METTYFDLPIVPPIDLNHNMNGIDIISPFQMQLRTKHGLGLFATRRKADDVNGLIRMHQGIDLLAPIGTSVYAVASGVVSDIDATHVFVTHDNNIKFMSCYTHVQNILVAKGDTVGYGQKICEVGDWSINSTEKHLHFEIRLALQAENIERNNTLAIDISMKLFDWERITYQNDADSMHIENNVKIKSIGEIVQGRNLRFLQINVDGSQKNISPINENARF
jgi:murein DD-endopeptidase MepM/ murein hydrolase activator NlpD